MDESGEYQNVSVIKDIFESWDKNESGFIEKAELAECCEDLKLSRSALDRVFTELDVDSDGRISFNDFRESFEKVCDLFRVSQETVLYQEVPEQTKFEKLLDAIGFQDLLTGHEYVTELFHHIHNAGDSPQLLSLLESFLFSVIRDIKNYESENQKLEEALKRTCEKHAEHMENLDEELEQQLSRVENRIKKEEKSKYERSSMDIIWQMENKNKEIQALQAKVQKLEARMKRKEPEEQKLKEEIDERVQEIRYLRSQVTDAQTNMAVLKSELVQLRNDYEDQTLQLENEKHTVMECVQEQESLTRQLQLLHEANKKLHDTNDDLRSALESRRASETGRSPSPSKRSSITTLYTPAPKPYKRSKSNINSRSPSVMNDGDLDRLTTSLGTTPLRSPMTSTTNSRRGSLLPIQQSCEVDEPGLNEDSLLNELIGVNHRRTTNEDSTQTERIETKDETNTNDSKTDTTETDRDSPLGTGSKESTTDVTSDSSKSDDKFPRTKTGSARISTKLGKYLVKLKQVTKTNGGNDNSNDQRTQGSTDKNKLQKTGQERRKNAEGTEKKTKGTKEEPQNNKEKVILGRARKQRESSRKELIQNTAQQKRGSEKSSLRNSGTSGLKRTKNSSVTFAPTVSNTRSARDQTRGRDVSRRSVPSSREKLRMVQDSETSDTDSSTRLDLKLNFPDGTEEEDEAYGTLPSSERESMRLNLNILAETNKRLCESNDDLRAALEAVSKRASKPRSREKCKRNTSFHSDYGSISSRSITPNQLQKSENDVADGAEDLSGYEPESDGNNTSTLTLQGRHDKLPDRISKTLATPRERIKIAGRETNDVIWESDHETETADQEQLKRHKNADETSKGSDSPFARNSLLRKPLRHKSIESLKSEMESKNSAVGKGDRSTWPALARKGKWNSLEQVRKKNEFAGPRSNSLPASRCQSSESLDFETGIGLSELSDKLNALKSSQENILSDKVGESKDTCHEPDSKTPNHLTLTKNNEINEPALGDPLEESNQVVRKELDSPSKSTNTQKIELVSSAVQVDMNSDKGRRTPLLQDGKTINQRPDSLNEQGKDKRKKKHSPREEKNSASKDSSKEGVKEALKEGSKRSSKEAKGKALSEKKSSKEGQRDGLKKASRDSSKEGLMEDSKQDSKQDSKERSKQGLETPIKSKESFSRSSNRGESPFRSPSTRPFSQTSNDNSSVPQDYLPNKSPYASPRSTTGYKKDSTNKGRSEILSLIAGERPGQDLAMVQHLRSEVEGNENPLLKSVVGEKTNPIQNYHTDLNRSITNDIFAPLNKSCPIFSTRKHFSDGAHRHDVEDGEDLNSSRGKWTQLRKMNPYNGALVHRVRQTESIADSDLSKVELLSAELEAQFKSVKEEDEEDIDEDDVDDEELAQLVAMATGLSDTEEETESDLDSPDGLRPTTLGTADLSEASTNTPYSQSVSQDIVPERMFKLVLAGDAAVGKSSFILRLCRNRFHNALNSTLGVDFQMKTLVVDGKNIALQLWDTAGQERFRSIAKSYFRKADGVLLLYDVTCETSFLDVRDWVEAIEESCTKPVPIMLCGNKTDLRQGYIAEGKSVISTESGQKIAKEYGALFTETSAKDNKNITEACEKLARMLQDVEDLELNRNKDKGMQLSETDAKEKKKSSCCPR